MKRPILEWQAKERMKAAGKIGGESKGKVNLPDPIKEPLTKEEKQELAELEAVITNGLPAVRKFMGK